LTHFLYHVTDTLGDLILELADKVDAMEAALLGSPASSGIAHLGSHGFTQVKNELECAEMS
jgi:hypothetical protein